MKIEGQPFRNSDTCEGVAYNAENATHDIAIVKISGRYPEEGWAMNETSDEIVTISEGRGKLIKKDEAVLDLEQGDGAFVEARTWFAWDGDMTLVMSCHPSFNPDQYRWKE